MISIAEAISDLLFARDTVVVPGLGAFVKKPLPAMVKPVSNYFSKPSSEITFDANLREDNDLVVNYISEKNDLPKEESRRLLAMFVSDCFNSLKKGKKVVLNDIGTLYYDWAEDLVLEPAKTLNYNADAFGLCDFTVGSVHRTKTKDEIKVEIEKQQKDKNTPVTVDEKAVHKHDREEDFDDERSSHRGWLWLLLGLLLLGLIGFGMYYFRIIDFGFLKQHSRPKAMPSVKPGTYMLPSYTVDWDEVLREAQAKSQQDKENTEETPTVSNPEANIRIIAGCFGQEENAARLTNTLKGKGFANAFYELRGSKWYVSFGRYATDEEATAALREIRANTEYKAWILK